MSTIEYGLTDLTAQEAMETDGGNPFVVGVVIGVALGAVIGSMIAFAVS